jgi:hypothetical protein
MKIFGRAPLRAYSRVGVCLLFLVPGQAIGQGSKITSETAPIEAEDQDNPQGRELWFRSGRTAPLGQPAAALRYRAHQRKMQLRILRAQRVAMAQAANASPAVTGTGWTALGPAPLVSGSGGVQDYGLVSGRVNAVAIDPADATANTVYVGGAYGGLWRSQNAASGSFGNTTGVTWTGLTDSQATLSFGAIALQPGNVNQATKLSNVIIVGTGEANSAIDSYYGLGFLRSADGGSTWTLISTANAGVLSLKGLGVSRMAFSTAAGQTSTVVAGVASAAIGSEDGLATVSSTRGIYTSTDAGLTWTHEVPTDAGVAIDATSATSVVYNPGAGKFYAAIREHGFYSSADGTTWTRLPNQPGGAALSTTACPSNPHLVSCPLFRGEIAAVPARNEMYVWYVDINFADKGIFRTLDGGVTWTQIVETGLSNCGDTQGCGTQQSFFNLDLAAVPNGSATDLYAGAVNEFKCTLNNTSSLTCSQGGWLNLTHVYGCPAIAHVHPDEHAIDVKVVGSKAILYLGNDGGVYRALDGFTLTSGSCGAAQNQFDSLNGTLGSMTQFVSFSQDPTTQTTILGGTQDNGSPATSQAPSNASWTTANVGDGGYNEINPNNPNEWFTANTDVSIQRCTLGAACSFSNFSLVINNGTLAGDAGPFYTPYILDPQATSEMLVGTCRIWRGGTTGTGFTAISNNFDTLTPVTCSAPTASNIVHQIRAIAAGGPKAASGFSNVVYAGTDGPGPLIPDTPPGGQVFVTTNAAGGPSTWRNVTSTINPNQYTISSVAIDTSDATGQTAFVAIMGFGTPHVFKTTNAGTSWTNFSGTGSGALPDAPANTLVVDSSAGAIYVGTDVGVFGSATASANWSEVGPASGPGFLPNVPVTKLRILSAGGQKLLRASTYGRGIWQFGLVVIPDYQINIPNLTQTVFPGQQATFSGTLSALNGFSSSVALSCAAGTTAPPSTCNLNPTSVLPTSAGTGFTLTAAGAIGDYIFNVHGVGSDASTTTHNQSVTLHVVDFSLTAPSPASITANRPLASNATSFQVSASGSFNAAVTLSCGGLPTGANCNFAPGASVSPASGSPVTVTLTVATTTATPVGLSPITISGSSGGLTKTQSFTLNVTANPDYLLAISNPSQSTVVTGTAVFNGSLTAFNGYNSAVNLACGTGAPTACNAGPPASVTPTVAGAALTVSVASSTSQGYSFTVTGTGSDAAQVAHSVAVTFTSLPDFTVPANSGSATVKAGTSAQYTLNFAPAGTDSTFQNAVTYGCVASTLPGFASCSFSPPQIAPGTAASTGAVTLSISTRAPSRSGIRAHNLLIYAAVFPLFGLVFAGVWTGGNTRKRGRLLLAGPFVLLLALVLTSCGGGGTASSAGGLPPPSPGTPPGTYTVTVNASEVSGSTTVQHSTTVSLTVQ